MAVFALGHVVLVKAAWIDSTLIATALFMLVITYPAIAVFCLLCALDVRDVAGNALFGAVLGFLVNACYWSVMAEYGAALVVTMLGTLAGCAVGYDRGAAVVRARRRAEGLEVQSK
jgi:hypothetical protein